MYNLGKRKRKNGISVFSGKGKKGVRDMRIGGMEGGKEKRKGAVMAWKLGKEGKKKGGAQ